ncbi:YihY/virulence factor BrkB family protein [Hoyosella subflava]|uniref:Ribonuclease BN n=1 Tax=Hoyosella subflava (strain DSM 45089 / JCM 17490 / NBRC 109087 / DQS3-9A1) TaxID=443218 RepID=F6EQ81_HOYSD|nr:YihY/virulence factor BrkB family protein [Hoyosella subflava]AEF39504.1 Ribonuclease BN [Hoyosella subflava DQS3-9A1]
MQLTTASWRYIAKKTGRNFLRDDCVDLAAALTFYAVLSLFPALLALVSLVGLLGQGQRTVDAALEFLADVAPEVVVEALEGPIEQVVATPSAGLAFAAGLIGALWTASIYVNGFGQALNRIHGVEEGRPFWKLRPFMLGVTIVVLVFAALVCAMLVVSGPILFAVGGLVGLGDTTLQVWNFARFPLILLLVMVLVALLYYATPNVRRHRFRWLSAGAVVAISVWVAGSIGFGSFVTNFATYNQTYGSLAGIVVFLLWLWITNIALLFGAELDSEIQRGKQLQNGVPAEDQVRLEPRDTQATIKRDSQREEEERDGLRLRRGRGHPDETQP